MAWRQAVAHYVRPLPGMRLLDVGAGTGSWAAALTRWFPGVDVLAVEPSAAMRDRCVHRPVVAGEATALPLRAGTVDAVWLSTVIHHLPDLAAAARELRRVLRPGGPVLIRSVPGIFPPLARSLKEMKSSLRHGSESARSRPMSPRTRRRPSRQLISTSVSL